MSELDAAARGMKDDRVVWMNIGVQCPVCLTFFRFAPAVVPDPDARLGLTMGFQVVKPDVGGCERCREMDGRKIPMTTFQLGSTRRQPKPKPKKRNPQ